MRDQLESMTWQSFIEVPRSSDHAVQIYREARELVESVGRYLSTGFEAEAPAIVIATPGHRQLFVEDLRRRRCDPVVLQHQGLLTLRDAEETLGGFMNAHMECGLSIAQG